MESYCLQWNHFETNIRKFFGKLRCDKHLCDVTLVSEDGQYVKAHKIILSAGSTFFTEIFEKNEDKNILIYLKGIKGKELKHVIDFLYDGQVNVAQNDLDDFFTVANEVKLMGLETNNEASKQQIIKEEPYLKSNNLNKGVDRSSNYSSQSKNIEKITDVVQDNVETDETIDNDIICEEEMFDTSTTSDLEYQIDNILDKKGGNEWNCKVCGKSFNKRYNARTHCERHLSSEHTCLLCTKNFRTKHDLKVHSYKIHKNL